MQQIIDKLLEKFSHGVEDSKEYINKNKYSNAIV